MTQNPMANQGYLIESRPKFTRQTNNCNTVMLKAYSPVHMHCKHMCTCAHLHMYVCVYEYGNGYNLPVCRFFCRNQKSTKRRLSFKKGSNKFVVTTLHRLIIMTGAPTSNTRSARAMGESVSQKKGRHGHGP